ncbi:hypothetical protein [Stenotrophomonas geniculata]|uniref:hypothetical protein n=1 Tax=Stenotrophomonas geniculata TaxID=86188 RepID=UPI001110E269|nr:hypothetical protein [Stenotrophomonas geniculata]WNF09041.1 hypothetical protein RKE57_13265 [Stenotrophomonas geniculata]
MAIELCPLAGEWGSWADWSAVAVGLIAAGGTIWVAWLARQTSERATAIAEEAKHIAQQQQAEAAKLRLAQARILGRQVLYEVLTLKDRVRALRESWESAASLKAGQRGIADGTKLCESLRDATFPLLPISQRLEGRIHSLPDDLGSDLATLIGGTELIVGMAERIQVRIGRTVFFRRWRYNGDPTDLSMLQMQLQWLENMSGPFAERFHEFVYGPIPLLR